MAVPVRQSVKIGAYVARQRLARRDKYALVLELEPLYQCNLACAGCGKIQHPDHVLRRRMPVSDAVAAVEECGAPVVSIAGGEPLIHPEIHQIVAELIARKRFVYLCTNALLMEKKMELFEPTPYFAWAVHMDGLRERHDKSVCRDGVFDKAVEAIREAQRRGFRVTTNTTFFSDDTPQTVREVLDYLNDELEVDQMMISPAYAYEKAPDQEHFPGVEQTNRLFRAAFADGRRRRWRLNHSPLFLDFLEGRTDFQCTAWGIPSYSVFGWQRPCYLMSDGYASSYRELLEQTDWEQYGRGRDPRCDNCMAHCGYEPTAVSEAARAPHKALFSSLRVLRS
jgi:hopanoid biosynthesis associated radical SAM protein HpnH